MAQRTGIAPGDQPQKPGQQHPKPPTQPPNFPGGSSQTNGPGDKPPQVLIDNADKLGFDVVPKAGGGWKLVSRKAGFQGDNPELMKFLQHASNKYGITQNGIADFTNAAYIGGQLYRLSTGQGQYSGNAVLTDEQLARARERAGWTPEVGYNLALADYNRLQHELGNPGSGELPTSLATPEGYQALLDRQRAVLTGQTASTGTGSLYQSFTGMTGEQQGVPGYPVTMYPDAASALTAAHTALASHYASAAMAGDFGAAATAQQAITAHQELLPQGMAQPTVPDTFSEKDLYLAQSQ